MQKVLRSKSILWSEEAWIRCLSLFRLKNVKWIVFVNLVTLVLMIEVTTFKETGLKRKGGRDKSLPVNDSTTRQKTNPGIHPSLRQLMKQTKTGMPEKNSSTNLNLEELFKAFPGSAELITKSNIATNTSINEVREKCIFCFGNQRGEEMTPQQFVTFYGKQCEDRNITAPDGMALCECVPESLIGRQKINTNLHHGKSIENTRITMHPGGWWKPDGCYARDKVAIIVPFRDRKKHLNILLDYLHPMLQKQRIHYRIFVIQQATPKIFNKASLMNVGYLEAKKLFHFDCVVFHDVDMIPEDDFYTCLNSPRHVGAYVNKWGYKIGYTQLVGGALLFTREQFEQVNGWSNRFYGWGGEDDDMYERLKWQKLDIHRYPSLVARYTMIKHERDWGNPYNAQGYNLTRVPKSHYAKDGISNVSYKKQKLRELPRYTWMHVDLPNPYQG